jgi:predicted  nucleic acid-binding Zn-ribbon protein
MPSRCTKCGKIHPDDAGYLLDRGCDGCGSRFFFFVKESSLDMAEREIIRLSQKEIGEIERDVRGIVAECEAEENVESGEEDETVILDFEAVKVIKPGKYRIDLTNLFAHRPIVIQAGSGKYSIDLATIMGIMKKRN